MYLIGSICLSDIPKELITEFTTKSGKVKKYLNVAIFERKQPSEKGHTHFLSCAPEQNKRVEGMSYIIGNFKAGGTNSKSAETQPKQTETQKQESGKHDDLPF